MTQISRNWINRAALALLLMALMLLPAGVQPAHAKVSAVQFTFTCSYVRVQGMVDSNAPSPTIEVTIFRFGEDPATQFLNKQLFTLPMNSSFNVVVSFPTQPTGTMLRASAYDFADNFLNMSELTSCTDPTFGPADLAGFQQRFITCDTLLYEKPGGAALAMGLIKAGQQWHVHPTPIADPWGVAWFAVYVGGPNVAYIPASCVAIPYPPTAEQTYTPGTGLQSGSYYIVQPGDTLYRISRRFGVSLRALAAYNGIVNINRIYVGQRLWIP